MNKFIIFISDENGNILSSHVQNAKPFYIASLNAYAFEFDKFRMVIASNIYEKYMAERKETE